MGMAAVMEKQVFANGCNNTSLVVFCSRSCHLLFTWNGNPLIVDSLYYFDHHCLLYCNVHYSRFYTSIFISKGMRKKYISVSMIKLKVLINQQDGS